MTVGKAGEVGRGVQGSAHNASYVIFRVGGEQSVTARSELGVCRGACPGVYVLLDTDVVTLLYQVG